MLGIAGREITTTMFTRQRRRKVASSPPASRSAVYSVARAVSTTDGDGRPYCVPKQRRPTVNKGHSPRPTIKARTSEGAGHGLVARERLRGLASRTIFRVAYSVCYGEERVSVRHALLALLSEGPKYGLQLRQEFEDRTGEVWPLNVGQVYTTLQRLERDGLVESDDDGERGRARRRASGSRPRARRSWRAGCARRPT